MAQSRSGAIRYSTGITIGNANELIDHKGDGASIVRTGQSTASLPAEVQGQNKEGILMFFPYTYGNSNEAMGIQVWYSMLGKYSYFRMYYPPHMMGGFQEWKRISDNSNSLSVYGEKAIKSLDDAKFRNIGIYHVTPFTDTGHPPNKSSSSRNAILTVFKTIDGDGYQLINYLDGEWENKIFTRLLKLNGGLGQWKELGGTSINGDFMSWDGTNLLDANEFKPNKSGSRKVDNACTGLDGISGAKWGTILWLRENTDEGVQIYSQVEGCKIWKRARHSGRWTSWVEVGQRGETGPAGPAGAMGPQGPAGARGPAGQDGKNPEGALIYHKQPLDAITNNLPSGYYDINEGATGVPSSVKTKKGILKVINNGTSSMQKYYTIEQDYFKNDVHEIFIKTVNPNTREVQDELWNRITGKEGHQAIFDTRNINVPSPQSYQMHSFHFGDHKGYGIHEWKFCQYLNPKPEGVDNNTRAILTTLTPVTQESVGPDESDIFQIAYCSNGKEFIRHGTMNTDRWEPWKELGASTAPSIDINQKLIDLFNLWKQKHEAQ